MYECILGQWNLFVCGLRHFHHTNYPGIFFGSGIDMVDNAAECEIRMSQCGIRLN